MSKLSRNGIAYDLKISPYKHSAYYEGNHIVFTFSSQTYLDKFNERITANREKITDSLSNRFGLKIENDLLCDINLYSKIEKRGFLLTCNGVAVQCLENIILDGKNLIIKI